MPKAKTKSGAKKRFRMSKKGRIKFRQGHRNHILTKKSPKRKRQLRRKIAVKACDAPAVVRMLAGS
jgi:large subunit ribosomal protein L35